MKKTTCTLFTGLLLLCIGTALAQPAKEPLETIGLYAFHPAQPKHYKFWKACGYNLLQFIDNVIADSVSKESHDKYYRELDKGIADAQKAGFKVSILILSNLSSLSPSSEVFNPMDEYAMKKRLGQIELTIKRLARADVFSFFGGDPGGSPIELGEKGVHTWMNMSRKVHEMVERDAPGAAYNANIWAVTHWDFMNINPFYTGFWDKEVAYGKMIVADKSFIGPDCGIEFPLHNYYRSLAFKAYADVSRTPEPYPVKADIAALKSRGVKRMWGWAHFLIDEVDDGYTGYAGSKLHPTQAETRYLHRIVNDARTIGLNGILSFTDGPGSEIEAMNVFAFGKFCLDGSITPEAAILQFSSYITDSKSTKALAQVISFIENHSTWEASIPERFRIKSLGCDLNNAAEALRVLEHIKPNSKPTFPIPEPATNYLKRLKSRLVDIQASENRI